MPGSSISSHRQSCGKPKGDRAMATYTKYFDFSEQLHRAKHDFGSHVFKIALTNTAPAQTHTGLAEITEISPGNGYTAGGTATTVGISESTGTTTVTATDTTFT